MISQTIISDLRLKFAEKTWNETFKLVRRCMVRHIFIPPFYYSFHFPFHAFFKATTVQIMATTQNPSLLALSMPSGKDKVLNA